MRRPAVDRIGLLLVSGLHVISRERAAEDRSVFLWAMFANTCEINQLLL
jgi:hypothetical protein